MSSSTPMIIEGKLTESYAKQQLIYLASLFNGTLRAIPLANLHIATDSHTYFNSIQQELTILGVPVSKIVPLIVTNAYAPTQMGVMPGAVNLLEIKKDSATITINYPESNPGKQRLTVAFKPEGNSFPVEVDFEVMPDGTMLSEVKAEWSTPLKILITDSARMGVRNVKFATKIVGLAGFDRKTVNSIETELKGKIKLSFSGFLKIKGHEFLKIQFYGAVGGKYAEEKFKPIGEVGVLFEIPFDLSDVLK